MVAFPTETVYGLGANALDEAAVDRIFCAKGRPATSPLIVHCADAAMARKYAANWPEAAEKLAERFWPGPLTLVLPKAAAIPLRVTAGLETVGLRVPRHPVALALLRAAQVPIAAPSANPFQGLSPTQAGHVLDTLADLILEGGPSEVGIESTVLSLVGAPTLLRPGMVTLAQLEEALGVTILRGPAVGGERAHASPGQHGLHYSPRTPLYLLQPGDPNPPGRGVRLVLPSDADSYARDLYAALHEADRQGWEWIAVAAPPETQDWDAIRDRLKRATHS